MAPFTVSIIRLLSIIAQICIISKGLAKENEIKSLPIEWAVRLPEGVDPNAIAERDGFINKGQIGTIPNAYLFSLGHSSKVKSVHRNIRRSTNEISKTLEKGPEYLWFEEQVGRNLYARNKIIKKSVGRGDFLTLRGYWHLDNDINLDVEKVWEAGYRGEGIHIAIVDDGVQGDHPDLSSQFVAKSSITLLENNPSSPAPQGFPGDSTDSHGTRCAGLIIGRHESTSCVFGVAPSAKLSSIKIISGNLKLTDSAEAIALSHFASTTDIYSLSWGPEDSGAEISGPETLAKKVLEIGTTYGRNGLGSFFIVAGGNGGKLEDDCNFDGYANSPYTIAVGGIGANGESQSFSEMCSAHLVVNFGAGDSGQFGLSTTDFNSKCTNRYRGTSASAPLMAGMIAIILSANPNLQNRDIQHILVRSSLKINPLDSSWFMNGANLMVSRKFGFGLPQGKNMLDLAINWEPIPVPLLRLNARILSKKTLIPLGGKIKIFFDLINDDFLSHEFGTVEHVQVTLKIKHPIRGKLNFLLAGPNQTIPRQLAQPRNHDKGSNLDWTFTTVHHWDEKPWGTWILEIQDLREFNDSLLNSYQKGSAYLLDFHVSILGSCHKNFTVIHGKKLICQKSFDKYVKRGELNTEDYTIYTHNSKLNVIQSSLNNSELLKKKTFHQILTDEKPISIKTDENMPSESKPAYFFVENILVPPEKTYSPSASIIMILLIGLAIFGALGLCFGGFKFWTMLSSLLNSDKSNSIPFSRNISPDGLKKSIIIEEKLEIYSPRSPLLGTPIGSPMLGRALATLDQWKIASMSPDNLSRRSVTPISPLETSYGPSRIESPLNKHNSSLSPLSTFTRKGYTEDEN